MNGRTIQLPEMRSNRARAYLSTKEGAREREASVFCYFFEIILKNKEITQNNGTTKPRWILDLIRKTRKKSSDGPLPCMDDKIIAGIIYVPKRIFRIIQLLSETSL